MIANGQNGKSEIALKRAEMGLEKIIELSLRKLFSEVHPAKEKPRLRNRVTMVSAQVRNLYKNAQECFRYDNNLFLCHQLQLKNDF